MWHVVRGVGCGGDEELRTMAQKMRSKSVQVLTMLSFGVLRRDSTGLAYSSLAWHAEQEPAPVYELNRPGGHKVHDRTRPVVFEYLPVV